MMLDLFWMLSSPDAQPDDWYGWVTVYAAHALIVGGGLAALLLVMSLGQWIGTALYVLWEVAQTLLFHGAVLDGLVDTSAVILGQALIWAAWRGRRKAIAIAGILLALIAAAGVSRRR